MMKVKINFTPYYEWYAKWIDWKKVSVNDFVNGKIENPFGMLDEWLDIISIKPKVPELGRLLAELYKENKVGRYRHCCKNWQDGYPKWFYIYYLAD